MQIIESTDWGVRSARITLAHHSSGYTVVLFPMIHVGEREFYERAYADAFAMDVVLVEGVNSPITTRVTRSYRWIAGSKRINLTVQPRNPPQDEVPAKIVHADLSRPEFERAWSRIPLWLRCAVYLLSPMIGFDRRWFGSRAQLAKRMSMDDAMSQAELVNWSPEAALLEGVLLDVRDARLLDRLREQIAAPPATPRTIAVVYGARHMRAVLRELGDRQGYACTASEWMMVFSL